MITLTIKEILQNNEYVLQHNNQNFQASLEFYGVSKIKAGNTLTIHAKLLNKNDAAYTMPLAFETTKEKSFQTIEELNDAEFEVLTVGN